MVYTGKAATALLMTGFSFMLLGLPKIGGIGVLGTFSEAFPGLDAREVPLGIFFVYVGVIFSLLTAVIYTVKGYRASKHAIEHPEEEDVDFLNPEIEEADGASGAS